MYEEYFKKLKEAAPKMMDMFCNIYGYTEYKGEYYNNYLIEATDYESNYVRTIEQIRVLQNNFDVNLENFKLGVIAVIDHLESNDYRFTSVNLMNEYSMQVHKNTKHIGTVSGKFLDYTLQDASIIAAKDLELNINLKQ